MYGYECVVTLDCASMKRAITYYRVSTQKQENSGLGLEAQRVSVTSFVASNGYEVLEEFIEVESGKNNKRPVLQLALNACKKHKAVLLIAKLDRLSRSVAFISTLIESGIEFKAVDNPNADKFVVHVMAAFAQHEREQISLRTRLALQAAKQRGIELGVHGKYVLSKENKLKAIAFAKKMKPVIDKIQAKGITSVRGITKELNKRRVRTSTGGKWYTNTVHTLLKRIKEHHL